MSINAIALTIQERWLLFPTDNAGTTLFPFGKQIRIEVMSSAPPAATIYARVPTDDLLLDPRNPRLVEFGVTADTTQEDILKILWEEMALTELAMSIAYTGYFDHEPLLVSNEDGPNYVIEGNRRLAAVKLLLSETARQTLHATDLPDIDDIDAGRRQELSELPVIWTTRKEAWRYLGFKHVNGPASWSSYAKAQYIARIRNEYGIPLDEIARMIGDESNTVRRMYRGLMVVEQAESEGVFSRDDVTKSKFYFNYIYDGITKAPIKQFIGLGDAPADEQNPVPKDKIDRLGELLSWLYGKGSEGQGSVIRSQNPDLATLATVLRSTAGVDALRNTRSLEAALEISQGDKLVFSKALQSSKTSLQKARGAATTGFEPGDRASLQTVVDIQSIASDLFEDLLKKIREQKQRAQVNELLDE